MITDTKRGGARWFDSDGSVRLSASLIAGFGPQMHWISGALLPSVPWSVGTTCLTWGSGIRKPEVDPSRNGRQRLEPRLVEPREVEPCPCCRDSYNVTEITRHHEAGKFRSARRS